MKLKELKRLIELKVPDDLGGYANEKEYLIGKINDYADRISKLKSKAEQFRSELDTVDDRPVDPIETTSEIKNAISDIQYEIDNLIEKRNKYINKYYDRYGDDEQFENIDSN